MKNYNNPPPSEWASLTNRPLTNHDDLVDSVNTIIRDVKLNGDDALIKYAKKYDDAELDSLAVSTNVIEAAADKVSRELKQAIQLAYNNITKFHSTQLVDEELIETMPGVKCWRKSVAIQKVGLYIPGGSAPLFSTVLMLGIPALIAGCSEIVLCTPPNKKGLIDSSILYAANLVGIKKIYKVGGAQAIAAMTFGTTTIPAVFKIYGPGNQYVTKAKEILQLQGVAIDMPAGPSELLVVADTSCNPKFVAADLLSQAEHGVDSQVILLSDSAEVINICLSEIDIQIQNLPRQSIALEALKQSKAIVFNTISDAFNFSNFYAPEHLIIASANASIYEDKIVSAGSAFLGNYSCESAGDYASGTNHTLPTNGNAKSYSGVSVDSFVKKITFQEITDKGIMNIGRAIEVMAEAEGLMGHKNAVTIRLNEK